MADNINSALQALTSASSLDEMRAALADMRAAVERMERAIAPRPTWSPTQVAYVRARAADDRIATAWSAMSDEERIEIDRVMPFKGPLRTAECRRIVAELDKAAP